MNRTTTFWVIMCAAALAAWLGLRVVVGELSATVTGDTVASTE